MSTNTDFDRHAAAWLADGPTGLSDRVLDAALREVHLTPQRRRLSASWRTPRMSLPLRAAAAVAIVAIGAVVALATFGPNFGVGSRPTPIPTVTPTRNATLTAGPTASLGPIDTAGWTTYTSRQYGFSIGHPAGWVEDPATRAWTFETDALAVLNAGQENFRSLDGLVRVSAWSVPLEPGQTIESWGDVEAWATTYCERTGSTECAAIRGRVVPMCIEKRDCHPALLIPFKDDVQAFGAGGVLPEGMLVMAVWRGESAAITAPYGGSQRLLEGFLSTMNVWPPAFPESRAAAATFKATGQ